MIEIVTFITNNWRVFVLLFIEIVTFVILLCKKKVKINDVFECVLLFLPELINEAESNFVDGSDKYSYVFNKCIEMLVSLTKCQKVDILERFTAPLNNAIENILSTPQKKGR